MSSGPPGARRPAFYWPAEDVLPGRLLALSEERAAGDGSVREAEEHTMPLANNNGVRIRYEIVGSGPPLLLHIGYTLGLEDWDEEGYIDALRDRFRLMLIDPRGQGQSDKPHEQGAYTLQHRVGDVVAVLDAAGIERAHYWGYSMGGRIGYATGVYAPERLTSLVIGGAWPFSGNPRPIEGDFFLDHLRAGMPSLIAWLKEFDPDFEPSADQSRRWLANDTDALTFAQLDALTEPDLDVDAVSSITVPTLIYCGSLDQPDAPEAAAGLMPNASFVLLDGLNHGTAFSRIDLVLPMVETFLAKHSALADVARGNG